MEKLERIVFVARSGSCREPMAMGILQDLSLKQDVEILARGLLVSFPEPMNGKAEAVLIGNGINLVDFTSKTPSPISKMEISKVPPPRS